MKREFFIETPLGKLRVYAKYEGDSPDDYPGVFVDFITPENESIILTCTEYIPGDGKIKTTVYDGTSEEPVVNYDHEALFDESDVETIRKQFERIPISETGCIKDDFYHFPAGTEKTEITKWLDSLLSDGRLRCL